MRSKFLKILFLLIAYAWFSNFGRSILPLYFLENGLTIAQIVLGPFLMFFALTLSVFIFRSFRVKKIWYLAIFLNAIYMALVFNVTPYSYYLGSIILGISSFFFWVPYNIAYFNNTAKNRIGISSSIMSNVWPLVGMVASILAGYLAQINYVLIWIFTAIFCLFPLILINKQDNFVVKYSVREALSEIRSTRIFIFFHGFWDTVNQLIPIFSLFFIKTPLYFGVYLAYLSLISILANFLLGHFTDKIGKRSVFLYPVVIFAGIITLLLSIAVKDIALWIIVTGAIQFISPIFGNLSTALVVDAHEDKTKAMAGREILLSGGRVLGLILVFLSLTFEEIPRLIFIPLALSMFLFAFFLFYNTRITKKFTYF
jgi:hypothetical protein